jgi:hypothetical protein
MATERESIMPFIGDHVIIKPIGSERPYLTGTITTHNGPIIVVRRDDNPMSNGELALVNTNAFTVEKG